MNDLVEAHKGYDITNLVLAVCGRRIILDTNLALLYGVTTKRLNEQYRRNLARFPEDFAFQISAEEWAALRSQFATLKTGRGSHRKYLPIAFTEHGALMAANIVNRPRAMTMSIYVIRAFVKIREDLVANAAILKRLAEIDGTLLIHDTALRDIYQKLKPLLAPPPVPPKPEIGFHVKEDALPYRVNKKVSRS